MTTSTTILICSALQLLCLCALIYFSQRIGELRERRKIRKRLNKLQGQFLSVAAKATVSWSFREHRGDSYQTETADAYHQLWDDVMFLLDEAPKGLDDFDRKNP